MSYNNIMKKFGIVLTTCLLISGIQCKAAYLGDIPQKTMQIAREAGYNNSQYNEIPNSKTVRVGIGTNNFASYEWKEASLYGTGDFELYNNKTYIGTYTVGDQININMVGNIFVLTDKDAKVIAKVSGPIIFKSDFGFIGIKDLKRAGKDAVYRNQIELISTTKGGSFYIVNSLGLEEYLRGVVPNEMPVSFGLEALKAQAVAARNYVLSPRVKANPNYDVVDSVASQVYFGANTEKELSNQAVMETSGIVALYGWDLILAQYSSTAGGYTESYQNAFSDPITKKFPAPEKPFLKGVPDNPSTPRLDNEEEAYEFYTSKPKSFDEDSSYYRWTREWNGQEIQDAIQANIAAQSATGFVHPAVEKGETIGIVKKLHVLKRGVSGKIMKLEIQTTDKDYVVEKELVIRRLLKKDGKALPSANVVFEHEYNDDGDLIYIKASGGGFGHGVGLSQYGAGYMAKKLHLTYDKILKHYYTNITLGTEPFILSANPSQNSITQNFWSPNGKGLLIIDNKYKVANIDISVNGVEEIIDLDTSGRYNTLDLSNCLHKGLNTVNFKYPQSQSKNKGLRIFIEMVDD